MRTLPNRQEQVEIKHSVKIAAGANFSVRTGDLSLPPQRRNQGKRSESESVETILK